MANNIIHQINANTLESILPTSTELSIDNLCIGKKYETVEWLDKGTTRHRTVTRYDFGFSVTNLSPYPMRACITLFRKGQDEYSGKKYYTWGDINSNEKSRIWTGFSHESIRAFENLQIEEIALGKTPSDGGRATWSAYTNPKVSIGELMDLKTLARQKRKNLFLIWVLVIFLIYLGFKSLIFLLG